MHIYYIVIKTQLKRENSCSIRSFKMLQEYRVSRIVIFVDETKFFRENIIYIFMYLHRALFRSGRFDTIDDR